MLNPQNAVGKPLVVYFDGAKRQIGTIERAAVKDGRLYIAADIDLSEGEPDDQD